VLDFYVSNGIMLVLVTVSWQVLGLRMEETASRYGGYLWMYWVSSHAQPTRCGPPAWGLGEGLTTPHCKSQFVTKCCNGPRNWLRIGTSGSFLWTR